MAKARKRLLQARKGKFWTLEDVAKQLEISAVSLHKWETGKSSPHPHNVKLLCELYGKSAAELDLEEGEEETPLQLLEEKQQQPTAFCKERQGNRGSGGALGDGWHARPPLMRSSPDLSYQLAFCPTRRYTGNREES